MGYPTGKGYHFQTWSSPKVTKCGHCSVETRSETRVLQRATPQFTEDPSRDPQAPDFLASRRGVALCPDWRHMRFTLRYTYASPRVRPYTARLFIKIDKKMRYPSFRRQRGAMHFASNQQIDAGVREQHVAKLQGHMSAFRIGYVWEDRNGEGSPEKTNTRRTQYVSRFAVRCVSI
jgi:hypothetical protein